MSGRRGCHDGRMGDRNASEEADALKALFTRSEVIVSRSSPRRAAFLLAGSAVAVGALAVSVVLVGLPLADRLVPVEVRAVYQSPAMYLARVTEHAGALYGVREADGDHLGGDGFLDPAELVVRLDVDPSRVSADIAAAEVADWIAGYPPTSGVYVTVTVSDGERSLQQRLP